MKRDNSHVDRAAPDPGCLILVVDDDPVLRYISTEILQGSGYRVEQAENGEVALDRFKEYAPALVLMDVQMPVVDGLTTCRAMRELSDFATTPILMLTARNDREAIEQAFEAGATDFIVKPVNPKILVERVRFALRLRTMASDLRQSQTRVDLARNLAGVAYWEFDFKTELLRWSDDLERILGLRAGPAGLPLDSIIGQVNPADVNRLKEFFSRTSVGDDPASVEFRFAHRDGAERHLYTRGQTHRALDGGRHVIIGSLQDITDLRNLEASHDFLLRHDPVTGLPNKALFMDRLGQAVLRARKDRTSFALVAVGVKNCDVVASSLGSDVCDTLIRKLSVRLAELMPEAETVARFGYGSFGLILSRTGTPAKAAGAARKALSLVTKGLEYEDHQYYLDAAAGISMFPGDGRNGETLFNNANTAMARSLEDAKGGLCFFEPEMNATAHRRLEMERELRRCLHEGGFRLHYQPQLDLHSARVVGCEALLRWDGNHEGGVGPAEFIPVLEDLGLINSVSRWVVRESCFQIGRWRQAGWTVPLVSVNLSAGDLQDPELVSVVSAAIAESGIGPRSLVLEITESVIMTDSKVAIENIDGLKNMGVGLALDDFGTGYSSLAYLQRLPIDTLKIDRSFVTDMALVPENEAIVRTIIELAHGLSMDVVAEGIEAWDVGKRLETMGCEKGQGFLFGEPVPADRVADWFNGSGSFSRRPRS